MIHHKKRMWAVLLGVFVAVFAFTFLTQKFKDNEAAQAVNPATFDPGYIISDWQMGNYTSMSETEIQRFLESKNSCDDRDYEKYLRETKAYPNVTWHWEDGHFVCMAEEKFGEGTKIGSGETAAHIIWQAARDYRINPQVIIVLLEKESSLVTDTYPNSTNYRSATGFACPDTAPCNAQYYGLKNQIRHAAALFREVLDGGWSNYPVGPNYIAYHPKPDPQGRVCGGSVVNIRNRATSALYRYTPYQPNAAALAAGYGTGDACSAYGNRNFYFLFEDWFGGAKTGDAAGAGTQTTGGRTVEDGVYRLYSKENASKVADVHGGAVRNARMEIYSKKSAGYENQVFEIKYNAADGYYNIINPTTGSAFDVRNAATYNNAEVDVYPLNSNCNQDWTFTKDGSGYYTIASRCSGRVIDVKQGTSDLIIYDDHNGDNQKWRLEKVAEDSSEILNGTYRFSSKMYPNEVIDIEGGLTNNGALISYSKKATNAVNQEFTVRYNAADGYYNIVNPVNGAAFDVKNGVVSLGNLTPVGVYPLHSECNQDWSFIEDSNGYYTIKSRCSGRVLDIAAGTRKIIIYDNHNGDNQKWRLEKVTK